MFKDLVFSIFTPNRRLPVFLFVGLKLVVIVLTVLLRVNLPALGDADAGLWPALYVVLMWISFCLLANRFHDGGTSAIFLLPLFLIFGAVLLFNLDPSVVGSDPETQQMWTQGLFYAQRPIALLTCAIIGLAIKLPTESGRNLYGMEFGDKDWATKPDLGGKGLPSKAESVQLRRSTSSRIAPVEHEAPSTLATVSWPQNGPSRRAGFGQR